MNIEAAWLMVRLQETLSDEGRGIIKSEPEDQRVMREAVEMCIDAGLLTIHNAYDLQLISEDDPRHAGCQESYCRKVR